MTDCCKEVRTYLNLKVSKRTDEFWELPQGMSHIDEGIDAHLIRQDY